MNIRQILIAVTAAAALTTAAAMAQSTPSAAPATPAATAPTDQSSGHKGRHEMKFEDRKAHALKRLEKSAATIQQKQACVQASTDKESLQACFPKRGQGKDNGKGKGGRHKHGGKGGSAATPAAAPAEQ